MAELTQTETFIRQAPFLEDVQKRLLEAAVARGETPVDIPAIQVAGLDPLTEQAELVGRGIGEYEPYLNIGASTIGTGLGSLFDLSQGVGTAFRAGAGTLADAITGLQGSQAGQPFYDQAGQALQDTAGQFQAPPGYIAEGFDPASTTAFFNPFEDAAVQQALSDIRRQGDIATNQLSADAVQAGAFGGSREGIQRAELERNILEQQGRTAAGMRQTGYDSAQQRAMADFVDQQRRAQAESQFGTASGQQAFEEQQRRQLQQGQQFGVLGASQAGSQAQLGQTLGTLGAGLGDVGASQAQEAARLGLGIGSLGSLQAGLAGQGQGLVGQQAQMLSQLGATQQTQAQRVLDAQRQTELQQSYEPFQRVSFISDIFKPQIGSAQSTLGQNVAPSPSPLSQAIGAGIAGFGAQKAFGNPLAGLFGGSSTGG